MSRMLPFLVGVLGLVILISIPPAYGQSESYVYTHYQCYPYKSYYPVTYGNKTYYKHYYTTICHRYDTELSVSVSPQLGNVVSISPLPTEAGRYIYYGSYPYSTYGYGEGYPGYGVGGSYTTVTLTATPTVEKGPGTRYVFTSWIVDGVESTDSSTRSVTMDQSHTILSKYRAQHHLKINVEPSVTSIQGEGWYDEGKTVTLNARAIIEGEPTKRFVFTEWKIDGTPPTAETTVPVTMGSPHTVTATYKTQYFVRVTAERGAPVAQGWYDAGSQVTIRATPEVPMEGFWGSLGGKYVFDRWSGDASGNTENLTMQVEKPLSAFAHYREDKNLPYLIIAFSIAVPAGTLLVFYLLRRGRASVRH